MAERDLREPREVFPVVFLGARHEQPQGVMLNPDGSRATLSDQYRDATRLPEGDATGEGGAPEQPAQSPTPPPASTLSAPATPPPATPPPVTPLVDDDMAGATSQVTGAAIDPNPGRRPPE